MVGERVHHTQFGLGLVVGEFVYNKLTIYHVRLDQAPPVHYGSGRNPIYAFGIELYEESRVHGTTQENEGGVPVEEIKEQAEELDVPPQLKVELKEDNGV